MKKLLTILLLLPTMVMANNLETITLSEDNTISFNSKFSNSYVSQSRSEGEYRQLLEERPTQCSWTKQ